MPSDARARQTALVPTPEPLEDWQARMQREAAERPPRPEGRDRVRSAAVSAVGGALSVLVLQLVVGRTSGLVFVVLVVVAAAVNFGVRFLANPRTYRNPWA